MIEPALEPGQLSVQVAAPDLLLTNTGGKPIYYLALEAGFAARALISPCADSDRCPRLNAGQQKRLPFSEVTGYEGGRQQRVIVYWWHLVPEGQGRWRVEDLQSVKVAAP